MKRATYSLFAEHVTGFQPIVVAIIDERVNVEEECPLQPTAG
jgi:hypothetical protein